MTVALAEAVEDEPHMWEIDRAFNSQLSQTNEIDTDRFLAGHLT